jgi:acyl-CoA reductase-like NAD-dependent aldehyde dehydrogenase
MSYQPSTSPFSKVSPQLMHELRVNQQDWSRTAVRRRVAAMANVAGWLVEHVDQLAAAINLPEPRPVEHTIAAELMPLADAIRFLQRQAPRLLSTRTLSDRDRPFWVGNLKVRIARESLGVVLIVGTWNYPVFLAGAQIAQALAAGNAVLLKPAPGTEKISEMLCQAFWDSGVSKNLLRLLSTEVEQAREAMKLGVDRVVVTGSSSTGRAILGQLTDTLTPATLELSGCDAMFVLSTADLNRVCDSILFGLNLNGSATCIAPRRVFIRPEEQKPLETRLKERMQLSKPLQVFPPAYRLLKQLAMEACEQGAEVVCGSLEELGNEPVMHPLVLKNVRPNMRLVQSDLFAPVISLITVQDWIEAVAADRQCPYALCASIFGDSDEAERRSPQIDAGCIVINDVIAATADPRVPFSGRGESGYGVTRGAEGLLEMTRVKAIAIRRGKWVPHLDPPHPTDAEILRGLFKFQHGGNWRTRWEGIKQLWQAIQLRRSDQ